MSNNSDNDAKVISFYRRSSSPPEEAPGEPAFNVPPVTLRLCLAMFLVQAAQHFMSDSGTVGFLMTVGLVPARYTGGMPFDAGGWIAPFAHLFVHGGWLHLGVNLGMLLAFGAALERAVGGRKLTALFLISGIAGSFCHVLFYPDLQLPLIGASGGASGLFGAVLMLLHRQQTTGSIVPREGKMREYRRLLPLIVIWVVLSVFFGFFGVPGAEGHVAWVVHIAGFAAGLILFDAIVWGRRRSH